MIHKYILCSFLLFIILCASCSISVDNSAQYEPEAKKLAKRFVLDLASFSVESLSKSFHKSVEIDVPKVRGFMEDSSVLGKPKITKVRLFRKEIKTTSGDVQYSYYYRVDAEYEKWLGVWEVVVIYDSGHFLGGFTVHQMAAKPSK